MLHRVDDGNATADARLECDLDAGFVLAFRRLDAAERRLACTLGGIDETASYEVETYAGGVEKVNGAALKHLVIDLPAPRSFKLLFYRRR